MIVFIDSTPFTRFYDPSCTRCEQPSRHRHNNSRESNYPPGERGGRRDSGIGPADAFIQVPHSNSFVRSRTYTRTCVTEGVVATTLRHRSPVSSLSPSPVSSGKIPISKQLDNSFRSTFSLFHSFHSTMPVESLPSEGKSGKKNRGTLSYPKIR